MSEPAGLDHSQAQQEEVLEDWLSLQLSSGAASGGRITEAQLRDQSRGFLRAFTLATARGAEDITHADFQPIRDLLGDVARARAAQGYSPTETATFLFSLKQALFRRIEADSRNDPARVLRDGWTMNKILDALGLFVLEAHQKNRDAMIARQQHEILELSTPVVQLWKDVVALPLIGTLDSARTQTVMDGLLQSIVASGAKIAIIDITGVPTVDTLVAQHLLKAVAAARLMGADCIISGVRPQIAQTMVHLGLELNVISKASLADAFALALRRTGRHVVRTKRPAAAAA